MSEKYTPVLIVLLIVASFAIGSMWTKIQYLQTGAPKAQGAAAGQVAGVQQQVPAGAQQPTQPTQPTKVNIQVGANDNVLGDPKAKVTLVEFSDYQCPYCEKWYTDTWPQIKKDYVDTGKVKFVYKNFAFLGQESTDAANAALCAREQNKFWEYHDSLFKNQKGENQGNFSVDNLKKFATDLSLNTAQFNKCLDAKTYNQQVLDDQKVATANGFQSTPSFAVGATPLVGAQPYAQFKSVIDSELSK